MKISSKIDSKELERKFEIRQRTYVTMCTIQHTDVAEGLDSIELDFFFVVLSNIKLQSIQIMLTLHNVIHVHATHHTYRLRS